VNLSLQDGVIPVLDLTLADACDLSEYCSYLGEQRLPIIVVAAEAKTRRHGIRRGLSSATMAKLVVCKKRSLETGVWGSRQQ